MPTLILALLLGACSAGHGAVKDATTHSYATDLECKQGLPFVNDYQQVSGRFDPQVETARRYLNSARDDATSRAALLRLATVLDSYKVALSELHPAAAEASFQSALIEADARMADQARTLAAQPAGSRDTGPWDAAVNVHAQALHDIALRISLLRSECQ